MQTLEAIHTRRSIRAFTNEPVRPEDLLTIIQAAAAAPSASNAQMWVFIGVSEPARIAYIKALSPGIIGSPTAVIVIGLDMRRRTAKPEGQMEMMANYDIGAAMQNILLAAHELGLGGCVVGSFHEKGLRAFLNLPDMIRPCLLIALGKPEHSPSRPRRLRPLKEVFFKERYEE